MTPLQDGSFFGTFVTAVAAGDVEREECKFPKLLSRAEEARKAKPYNLISRYAEY